LQVWVLERVLLIGVATRRPLRVHGEHPDPSCGRCSLRGTNGVVDGL